MKIYIYLACLLLALVPSSLASVALTPTSCAYTSTHSSTFSSVGILTLNIKTVGTFLDELIILAPTASVIITSNAYSSASVDVASYTFSSSHVKTTLSYTATLPTTQSTATCKARTVVSVSAPASVHTICFNGACYCNCAAKGAGVNIHFTTTNDNTYNTLNYTGFGSVRMDFSWSNTETQAGVYNYAAYTTLTNNLVGRDITPYYILDYSHALYNNGQSPNTTESIDAFARWAANSTIFFQGKNIIWEMYNEPNIKFWTPTPNVNDYIRLADATGEAIKAVTPGEVHVGPTTATYDVPFITACLQSGLLDHWDAVSVHFYRGTNPETVGNDMANLRQIIRKNLPGNKIHVGILSGEWGYTTATNSDARSLSEERQAQYIAREYLNNLANDSPVSIWYDFRDDGTDPTESEDRFGLHRYTYTNSVPAYAPKPAGLAARNFFSKVRNLRFNKRIYLADPAVNVLLFTNAEQATSFVLAAWTTSPNATSIKIPASAGTFSVSNMYGNVSSTVTAAGGFITITVSQSPQYLTPTATNAFLQVASSIRRLPIDIVGVGAVNIPVVVRNPLSTSIQVIIGNEAQVTVAPGQAAIASISFFNDLQNTAATTQTVLVQVAGMGNLTLSTNIIYDYPIDILATQLTAAGSLIQLSNPTGKAFNGNLSVVVNGQVSNTNVTFTTGQTLLSVTAPTGLTNLTVKHTVAVAMYDPLKRLISTRSESSQLSADFGLFANNTLPSTLNVYVAGNASVSFSYTLAIGTPPTPKVPVIFLQYNVAAGWKYMLVSPKTFIPIDGVPTGCGSWIYGDGKSNWANVRLRDSTGQTLQYSYGQVTWTGWKHVTINFSSKPGYWGGANDGIPHPPLFWDTYFVWDSSKAAAAGTIFFSAPTVFF